MKEISFVAIGPDELGRAIGKTYWCKLCEDTHPVETSWGESETVSLQIVKCSKRTYLVGVNGRTWFK